MGDVANNRTVPNGADAQTRASHIRGRPCPVIHATLEITFTERPALASL